MTKLLYKKRIEREIKGGGKKEQEDECRAKETERRGKVREGGKVHEGAREGEAGHLRAKQSTGSSSSKTIRTFPVLVRIVRGMRE